MTTINLKIGNCKEVLQDYDDNSIDAVVTDPPYGLGDEPDPLKILKGWVQEGDVQLSGGGFMNSDWDRMVPGPATWEEVRRVLKPGASGLVFSGTRTLHLMMASLRFSGFEIEDVYSWNYGSGFPKSYNIKKGILRKIRKDDRYADNNDDIDFCSCTGEDYIYDDEDFDEGGTPDEDKDHERRLILDDYGDNDLTCRVCSWCLKPDEDFIEHTGRYGTALKPSYEPVVVVKKPLEPVTIDYRSLLKRYGCSEEEIEEIMNSGDD